MKKILLVIFCVSTLMACNHSDTSANGESDTSTAKVITDTTIDDGEMMKDSQDGGDSVEDLRDITEKARTLPEISTFVKALQEADMIETFKGAGTYTTFAPNNEAFNALPKGTMDNLMKPENKQKLQAILKYHIVYSPVLSSDLKNGMFAQTIDGNKLKITMNNGPMVNDAKITKPDIKASNGVIHIIDKVLMPGSGM